MTEDLFAPHNYNEEPVSGANAPQEYSVSELSNKLKNVVENEFGYVRVRGELSRVTIAKSGHMYSSLKDDNAVLDAICWKGSLSRLSVRPEEGIEVICTGRLTTYPGRSNYQMIIETMEMAGEGALLKMLEERRKKLASEGLFDESRKKAIPFLPKIIGVVTSPTGAVIRDIMHRLSDRFPRHVLIWPVMVQGDRAAQQVTEAIKGFNTIPENSPHRPDLLIIARGGGSLEDLMPFNDESLVRAVADSKIPLISAIGHETDTTLIDYASDLRAPTPTGAAEKAVPVRTELLTQIMDDERRLLTAAQRRISERRTYIEGLARGLGDPKRLLENRAQKLDHLSSKLDNSLQNWLQRNTAELKELSAKLSFRPILQNIQNNQRHLDIINERLVQAGNNKLGNISTRLNHIAALLETLSFKKVLERGFTLIRNQDGKPITASAQTEPGQNVNIQFHDGNSAAEIKK